MVITMVDFAIGLLEVEEIPTKQNQNTYMECWTIYSTPMDSKLKKASILLTYSSSSQMLFGLFPPTTILFELFSRACCSWTRLIFDLPCPTDWKARGYKCQLWINDAMCIYNDCAIGDRVLISNEGLDQNARDKLIGHFTLINNTYIWYSKDQCGCITEGIDIRRLRHYFQQERNIHQQRPLPVLGQE